MEERSDRFTAIEDQYAGYTVYDQHYEKIGNVDDLFVDENDSPEYIGVKMGFLGTRTTLIPFHIARVNDARQIIEVAADKETLKNGPTVDDETQRRGV
jgi:ribosomal 30S subunit maturation factor RimM